MAEKTVEIKEENMMIVVTITGKQYDDPPTIETDAKSGERKHKTTVVSENKNAQQGVYQASPKILANASRTVTVVCTGVRFELTIPTDGTSAKKTKMV
jgi:hypothetical protein